MRDLHIPALVGEPLIEPEPKTEKAKTMKAKAG